jgi:hypothetical protein
MKQKFNQQLQFFNKNGKQFLSRVIHHLLIHFRLDTFIFITKRQCYKAQVNKKQYILSF